MPSNFPGSADSFPDAATIHAKKQDGTVDPSPPSATYHSDLLGGLGDAIEAVEGWLLGGQISFEAQSGQTEPILDLKDENGNTIVDVLPQTIGTELRIYPPGIPALNGGNTRLLLEAYSTEDVDDEATLYFDVAGTRTIALDSYSDLGSPTSSYTTLTMRAMPSQILPLLDLRDENAGTVFAVGPTGFVTIAPSDGLTNGQFVIQAGAGSSDNDTDLVYVKSESDGNVFTITANGGVDVREIDAGQDGIKFSSHGNLLHLGHYGGSYDSLLTLNPPSPGFSIEGPVFGAITRWTTLGDFIIKGTHSAPADATLANGECGIWFDQTVDATKIKFKAKDSAGTIRTGEIALT